MPGAVVPTTGCRVVLPPRRVLSGVKVAGAVGGLRLAGLASGVVDGAGGVMLVTSAVGVDRSDFDRLG